MIRKAKQTYSDIYSEYPLIFWKKCIKCEHEFRREKGYRKTVRFFGHDQWAYVCGNCATDKAEANKTFNEYPKMSPPPNKPIPPPNRVLYT